MSAPMILEQEAALRAKLERATNLQATALQVDASDLRGILAELTRLRGVEAGVARLIEAAKTASLNYARTNHDNPDMMGDDEFEAWWLLDSALMALGVSK